MLNSIHRPTAPSRNFCRAKDSGWPNDLRQPDFSIGHPLRVQPPGGSHGPQTPAEKQRDVVVAGCAVQDHSREVDLLDQGEAGAARPLREQRAIQSRARPGCQS